MLFGKIERHGNLLSGAKTLAPEAHPWVTERVCNGNYPVSRLARSNGSVCDYTHRPRHFRVRNEYTARQSSGDCRVAVVTVRRERRWTSAGATPARELVRSTR